MGVGCGVHVQPETILPVQNVKDLPGLDLPSRVHPQRTGRNTRVRGQPTAKRLRNAST